MSSRVAHQATEGNDPQDIKDPKLGWMIGFMFVVSFLGLFSLVPLRKVNPVYKLFKFGNSYDCFFEHPVCLKLVSDNDNRL